MKITHLYLKTMNVEHGFLRSFWTRRASEVVAKSCLPHGDYFDDILSSLEALLCAEYNRFLRTDYGFEGRDQRCGAVHQVDDIKSHPTWFK